MDKLNKTFKKIYLWLFKLCVSTFLIVCNIIAKTVIYFKNCSLPRTDILKVNEVSNFTFKTRWKALVAEDDFHCSHMANLFKTQNCSLILQSGSFVQLGYTPSSIVLLIA